MKLTVDISDELAELMNVAITQSGTTSATAFIYRAILNELERLNSREKARKELADLAAQIQELRRGQKAIIALVDASATIFSDLLPGRTGMRQENHRGC